jgi:hypothetical protein
MLFSLLLIGGTIVLVLIGAWRVRRHQEDIDAFEEREFTPAARVLVSRLAVGLLLLRTGWNTLERAASS